MKIAAFSLSFALLAASAGAAHAQAVQLPSFRYFGTSTSVLVPDRGGTSMGGVSRSSSGRSSRGVPGASGIPFVGRGFGNSGIGNSTSTGTTKVQATIIDNEELDRQVLAEAAARQAGSTQPRMGVPLVVRDRADFISRNVARRESFDPPAVENPAKTTGAEDVEKIRRDNAAALALQQAEAEEYFAKAQAMELEGKRGVAKIYYQMAARRASGELKARAAAKVAGLSKPAGSVANSGK